MNSLRAARSYITKAAVEYATGDGAGRAISATHRPVGAGISRQRVTEGNAAGNARTGIADHDGKANRVTRTYRAGIFGLGHREIRTLHINGVRAGVVSSVRFVAG